MLKLGDGIEPIHEFICLECHGLFSVAMRPVSPAKCDLPVRKGNQAAIGNGYSMCVAAKIAENIFRAAEGPFAVDDPVVTEQLTDKGVKRLRVRKMLQFAMEAEFALGESILESLRESLARNTSPSTFCGRKKR